MMWYDKKVLKKFYVKYYQKVNSVSKYLLGCGIIYELLCLLAYLKKKKGIIGGTIDESE